MTETIASLQALVGADVSGFQAGLREVRSGLTGVGANLSQFGQSMTMGVTLPVIGALGAVLKAASDSELVMSQLDSVLKSTHGAAGVTSKAATELASSLAKVTRYDDEAVLSTENLLLTFTKIGKDVFPDVTKMALDMSTAMGQDTKSSAVMLGKALQDPINGVTALKKVGVNFTATQEAQIRNFMATNQIAKAQGVILAELQTEFGGSAEAAGNTFAGSLDKLKNSIGDVMEGIGAALIPAIQGLVLNINGFVQGMGAMNPSIIQAVAGIALFAAAIGPVAAAIGFVLSPIGLIAVAVGGLFIAFQSNFGGIRDIVMNLWNSVKEPLDNIKNAVSGFFNSMGQEGSTQGAAPKMRAKGMSAKGGEDDGIAQLTTNANSIGRSLNIGEKLSKSISEAMPLVVDAFKGLINGAYTWLSTDGMTILSGAWAWLSKGVSDALPGVTEGFKSLINGAYTWLSTEGVKLLSGAWDTLVDLGAIITKALPNIPMEIGKFLGGIVRELTTQGPKTTEAAFTGLFQLGNVIGAYVNSGQLVTDLTNLATGIGNTLKNVGGSFISGALQGLFNISPEQAAALMDAIGKNLMAAFDNTFGSGSTFQKTVSGIVDSIGNLWTGLTGTVSGVFTGVVQAVKNAIADGLDFIAGVVEKLAGIPMIGDKFGGVATDLRGTANTLRGKALGGPVSSMTPYLVGEKGPELFVPGSHGNIVNNAALMNGNKGSGGGSTLIINNPTFAGVTDVGDFFNKLSIEANRRNMNLAVPRR